MIHGIFTASFYALTLIFQDPAETTVRSHSNLTDILRTKTCTSANVVRQTMENKPGSWIFKELSLFWAKEDPNKVTQQLNQCHLCGNHILNTNKIKRSICPHSWTFARTSLSIYYESQCGQAKEAKKPDVKSWAFLHWPASTLFPC